MVVNLKQVCCEILWLNKSIRFAGIAIKMGKVVAHQLRENVNPMLTFDELESFAIKSVLRMMTREDHEAKPGRAIYTFTL
jgi:hypothetical protein